MRRITPRETRRMMERLGINTTEMPDVSEVILRTETKEIIIREPTVTTLDFQGQKIFQIVAQSIEEKDFPKSPTSTREVISEVQVSDEDAYLVATQAKSTIDEAKAALKETGGDLAQAILILSSRRK